MKKEELIKIQGGSSKFISSSLLNAISKAINTVLELGRTVGSAVRRGFAKNVCKL